MPSPSFENRCIDFSAGIYRLISLFPKGLAVRTIGDQLLRSATSVGANIHEARSAESRADFIHKMQIALKEARESTYWLAFVERAKLVEDPLVAALYQEAHQLTAILAKSVLTSKHNSVNLS